MHFLVETDANTLVAQLNRSVTDLPRALLTRWLAWINLWDFEVRHVLGKKNGAADGLSRRPFNDKDVPEFPDSSLDDLIDADLNAVIVSPV